MKNQILSLYISLYHPTSSKVNVWLCPGHLGLDTCFSSVSNLELHVRLGLCGSSKRLILVPPIRFHKVNSVIQCMHAAAEFRILGLVDRPFG